MHLCAGLTAASWIMEPFGEIMAHGESGHFRIRLACQPSLLDESDKYQNLCDYVMPTIRLARATVCECPT